MQAHSTPIQAAHRRIKRHVWSPEHRFVAVVPPELASICQQELHAAGIGEGSITEAGVEFTGKIELGYGANLWSRTASRVLIRVHRFRAGALEELFHKVALFPWDLWISPLIPLQIDAHVRYSRIEHEGRAEETVLKAIQRCFASQGPAVPAPAAKPLDGSDRKAEAAVTMRQRILVHVIENHCEISLDTTGDHLHRRGYRLHHAGAPLRETLAAGILLRSGWKGDMPLADGMCGAGTFPIEAAMLARGIAPGLGRSFLFERWPSFAAARWSHLRSKAREAVRERVGVALIGLDANEKAVAVAQDNARRAGVADDIAWNCVDLFEFFPVKLGLRPGMLLVNPPYGRRLESAGRDFYDQLGRHAQAHFPGWRLTVLAPERGLLQRIGLPRLRTWQIVHGGLPIVVGMGRV